MSGRHYRVVGSALLLLTVLGMPRPATAQLPLDAYLGRAASPGQPASALRKQIATLAQTPAGKRMLNDLRELLPHAAPIQFARLIAALDSPLNLQSSTRAG